MSKAKFKSVVKQIPDVNPTLIDDFCMDIEFDIEKKFRYIGDSDKYGEYSYEELYVPFNDKDYKVSIANIDDSYDELKKHYIDVIEKQKKYITYRSGYFHLDLFAKDGKTGRILGYISGYCYNGFKRILNLLCKEKNGILLDEKKDDVIYDEVLIFERIDDAVYIIIGTIFPDIKITPEDIMSFVKIDAKQFLYKVQTLTKKMEQIMKKLKKDFGEDYWNRAMSHSWNFRSISDMNTLKEIDLSYNWNIKPMDRSWIIASGGLIRGGINHRTILKQFFTKEWDKLKNDNKDDSEVEMLLEEQLLNSQMVFAGELTDLYVITLRLDTSERYLILSFVKSFLLNHDDFIDRKITIQVYKEKTRKYKIRKFIENGEACLNGFRKTLPPYKWDEGSKSWNVF